MNDVVIAVDVGGTTIKAAVIDSRGHRTHAVSRPTPPAFSGGQQETISAVVEVIASLQSACPAVNAAGLIVPGIVDDEHGVAVYSENIGWHDIPFRALVQDAAGLPVGFGHDVRTAALVEHEFGSGSGIDEFLFMPIGTGISAGMFTGGRQITGELAGEIGHIDVGTGVECACGSAGCLETISSARSIARRYNELSGADVAGAAEVAAAARHGDSSAGLVWAEATTAIAKALTTYITLLAPQVIAIGGGLAAAGEQLLAPVRAGVQDRLVWQKMPVIRASAFGSAAGQLGAAMLAFRARHGSNPDFRTLADGTEAGKLA